MSASLVGSEMCIRDSDQGGESGAHRPPHGEHEHPLGKWESHVGADIGPVSYTHLTLPTICSV
eukprot:14351072-Alexandrium_andersonii.AAC.1